MSFALLETLVYINEHNSHKSGMQRVEKALQSWISSIWIHSHMYQFHSEQKIFVQHACSFVVLSIEIKFMDLAL